MSLTRFANTCSHLKNASNLRLGLTSIPYTRAQLSLCLLLLKQGFFSQVRIAGSSPPASCFPDGMRTSDVISAHPHKQRDLRSREAALTEMVMKGRLRQDLAKEGWAAENLEWAYEQSRLSKEQLIADGWTEKLISFLVDHGLKPDEQLSEEGISAAGIALLSRHDIPAKSDQISLEIDHEYAMTAQRDREDGYEPLPPPPPTQKRMLIADRLRAKLHQAPDFSRDDLAFIAGPAAFASPRHLLNDGITEEAMGLTITGQPFTPVEPALADPWQLEEENVITMANRASRRLWLGLKYFDGEPVLRGAELISKPTKRISLTRHELSRVVRGQQAGHVKPLSRVGEILAVHTNLGLLEARECVERNVGGQVICRIW
nr:37s ribosomal protein subunit s8, mitochondrial [Quercus suber]